MKVLMVSRYAEPRPTGFNANVYRQAASLQENFGVDIEILTWPYNDLWKGPVPSARAALPPMRVERGGLTYQVFIAPLEWNETTTVIGETAWKQAVTFGMELLSFLRPDIVHLQHRHGLWWVLEASQRLGIPTVYSSHDWGMACLRTELVMGDGTLCDGHVAADKCAACIVNGRGVLGKLNEAVVRFSTGRSLIERARRSGLGLIPVGRGAVSVSARERVEVNLKRVTRVFRNLNALLTPSRFGRDFYARLGVPAENIVVMPWYNDPVATTKTVAPDQPFTMTYIGRVSREKGVHHIFSALEQVQDEHPMILRVAGADGSPYCSELRQKYSSSVGSVRVEWLGWTEVAPLYNATDVVIIPSIGMDNTPLSLVEALSYRVPVVGTRIPPIEELVTDGENGYLAEFNSVPSLADAVRRAVSQKERIRSGRMSFPSVITLNEYVQTLVQTYRSIS